MRLPPSLTIAMGFLMVGNGCTTTNGTTYSSDNWPAAKERLGRVVVLPGSFEEVNRLTEEALRALPGTEVIEPSPLLAALGAPSPETPIRQHRR